MKRFNVRVYAIVINDENQILLCDETHRSKHMVKFPGGGLEWGEGILDCLKRELMEELNLQVLDSELFYVTDFFQSSFFNPDDQVISVYYKCAVSGNPKSNEANVDFFWMHLEDLSPERVTFPIDKHVVYLLKNQSNSI